jgi:hypothetical protein
MAYANSVGITYLHPPEPEPQRNALLWRLYTTFDPNNPAAPRTPHETWVEQASVSGGAFSFNLGPALQNGQIALSIQEAGWDGPLFRSGLFDPLPTPAPEDPAGAVDVFVPDPVDVPEADVQVMFQSDSFVRDHNTGPPPGGLPREPMITSMRLELGHSELTITATYEAKELPATDYSRTFAFKPSSEMRFSRQLLEIEEPRPPSGRDAASASTAIGFAITGVAMPLARQVEREAMAAMARFTVPAPQTVPQALPEVAPPPTGLTPAPPIVSLSARRVVISPTGIRIFAALGTFGSLPRKIFPGWPPQAANGKKCALKHSAVLSVAALNFDLLQSFRDRLMTSEIGRRVVALYYHHGAEVVRIVDANPRLARTIVAAVRDLQSALEGRHPLTISLRRRGELVLRQIASHGSPALRQDVDSILRGHRLTAIDL